MLDPPSMRSFLLPPPIATLAALLLATTLATFAAAQSAAAWSLLQDGDFFYVSTADPATGFPRPSENGELFFYCDEGDSLYSGAVVDAGPSSVDGVSAFSIGGERVEAISNGEGFYLLGGQDTFLLTAAALALALRDANQAAVSVESLTNDGTFPLVTVATGAGFASTLSRLSCIEADFAAQAPASDPFADAPAAPGPSAPATTSTAGVPSGGDAFAALLAAGGDVRLPAGTFTLPYDVAPTADLSVIGAGVDATILRMPAIELSGLSAEGVNLVLQNLTIIVDGPALGFVGAYGDAIAAFGGDLILRNLSIVNRADHGELGVSGATLLSGTLSASNVTVEGFPLSGIYVEGGIASLRDVTLRGNRNGIQLEGFDEQPYAELRDVTLTGNEWAGIAVYREASALVSGGLIAGNLGEAAFVSGTGSLTLENLDVENHAGYGVVAEGGRAVVRNVTLRGNANAIWALLDSTVTVERSDVLGSSGFGVAGNGNGTTTLTRVTVDGSELSAVHAEESRTVIIASSTVRNAGESGVNLRDDARGEVRDSRIEDSAVNGIDAQDAARVTVIDTVLAGNASYGVRIDGNARHDLQGVTYDGNGAGPFVLPNVDAAAAATPAESAPARPSRPSRSGAGGASSTPPPAPAPSTPAPSAPSANATGSWSLNAAGDVVSYVDGDRELGFVCAGAADDPPVIFLVLPGVPVAVDGEGIASFGFARANGSLGSANWNFLDLGDGFFATDDVATDDIALRLLPDDDPTAWNTVVVSVAGQGAVLVVPGELRVAELYGQLVCVQ